MLVPAVGVRVFAGVRGALEGFVACDVGLGGAVAGIESVHSGWESDVVTEGRVERAVQRCDDARLVVVFRRGLKPPLQHGRILVIRKLGGRGGGVSVQRCGQLTR